MILALSTSSMVASVALIEENGTLLWSAREDAPRAASGACLRLIQSGLAATGSDLSQVKLFTADIGPGSFTGVRVGVTLAKTMAFVSGAHVAGATSFDLVDPGNLVVLPSKRGEWFVRMPGASPVRVSDLELAEHGWSHHSVGQPDAARFAQIARNLQPMAPEHLLPLYLAEPSISVPKQSYGGAVAG